MLNNWHSAVSLCPFPSISRFMDIPSEHAHCTWGNGCCHQIVDMVQWKAGCEQLIEAHRKHCVRYWRHCSRHKLCGKHCFNTSYPVRGLIDSCRQVIISLTYQHSAVSFVPLIIGGQRNDSKSKNNTRYTFPKGDLNKHYASRPFLCSYKSPSLKWLILGRNGGNYRQSIEDYTGSTTRALPLPLMAASSTSHITGQTNHASEWWIPARLNSRHDAA